MEFKVDENLPIEASEHLREAGHDAVSVHDQRMVGETDSRIANVCHTEHRAILTLDLDFADIRTYPPGDYHGIVVLRARTQAKPEILDLISRVLPLLESETLQGKLWIVQTTGVRIREGETERE